MEVSRVWVSVLSIAIVGALAAGAALADHAWHSGGAAPPALPAVAQATGSPGAATNAPRVDGAVAPDPIAQAQALSTAFSQAAERVENSVVEINVEAQNAHRLRRGDPQDPFEWWFQVPGMPGTPGMPGMPGFPQMPPNVPGDMPMQHGTGSGLILRSDGYILTNNHVVSRATHITVRLHDRRRLPATVVGADPGSDLAILRVNATNLPAAQFGDSDAARVGEWVVAVGSPFGLDYTVTAGVLSAKGRGGIGMNPIEDYLQTDASINPGNSGGPLCNLRGQVLGINTMIVGMHSGIGFAIPSNLARRVADQLIGGGRVRRAWIGVGIQELTPELAPAFQANGQHGALVNSVVPDGPAARAGVRAGDVITNLDSASVGDGQELVRLVLQRDVGRPVRLRVLRAGRPQEIAVTTGERPASEDGSEEGGNAQPNAAPQGIVHFGLRLGSSPQGGVVVESVQPGSPADQAGVHPGDFIAQVGSTVVTQPATVAQILQRGNGGVLLLRRNDQSFFVALRP